MNQKKATCFFADLLVQIPSRYTDFTLYPQSYYITPTSHLSYGVIIDAQTHRHRLSPFMYVHSISNRRLAMQAPPTLQVSGPREIGARLCRRSDLPALHLRLLVPSRTHVPNQPHEPTMSYPAAAPAQPQPQICNQGLSRFRKFISYRLHANMQPPSKFQLPGSVQRSRVIRLVALIFWTHLPSPFRPVPKVHSMTLTPRIGPILRLPVLYYLCCYCITLVLFPAHSILYDVHHIHVHVHGSADVCGSRSRG